MIYGYARVSTREQCLDRQLDALNAYKKLDRIFTDKQSGKNFDRAGYQQMKSAVVAGDEVVFKELDRLGRNKDEMKKELEWFRDHGVTVRVLDIATTRIDFQEQDWIREMVNNILIEVIGAMAEQEREKTRRRQREGIEAMKARGDWERYGRPKKPCEDFEKIAQKQKEGLLTVAEACETLGISRATYYRKLKEVC